LELPSGLSPSKVSSFKDCALAFRFSAIDKLPEPPSVAATRGTLLHLALQRVQVIHPSLLRVIVANHEILAIEREGDLGRCGRGLQGRELRIGCPVKDQHLVGILSDDIEAIAHRIGQQVRQVSRNVNESAALIGVAIVD